MEKFAAGINLPMVAINNFNPNFWFLESEKFPQQNLKKNLEKFSSKKVLGIFYQILV